MLYYTKTWLNLNWRHQLHILLIVIVRGLSSLTQQYIVVVKHIFIFLHLKNWNNVKFSFLMMFFYKTCSPVKLQGTSLLHQTYWGSEGKGEREKGRKGGRVLWGDNARVYDMSAGGGRLMHLMLWYSISFIHSNNRQPNETY